MQLPEILYFVYTIKFLFNTEASAQIRIPSALIDPVPQLFTTDATGILKQFILLLLLLSLIILIVLALVFGVFTTRRILAFLAAAPPHFTGVFRLVLAAGPIEVLLLIVLVCTLLARLHATGEVSFLCN